VHCPLTIYTTGQTLRGPFERSMISQRFLQLCRVSAAIGALAFGLAGCGTAPVIPPGTQCEVIGSHAPFYKYGPAQSFGADEIIAQGTTVTLLERGFGFSRVMRPNGMTGYISTEDLRPMAPEPVRDVPPRLAGNRKTDRTGRTHEGPVKRSNVKPTPGDPLFDINDVPLPSKEPTPKPEPKATPTPPPQT
jgi:hypothetical protein